MNQEFTSTNSKITKNQSTGQQLSETTAKSGGKQFEDLERNMKTLAVTNSGIVAAAEPPPSTAGQQQALASFEGFLPSSSSSSSNSSMDAGLNGLGDAGPEQQQQPTPKRSLRKKCLHLDLSISNCQNIGTIHNIGGSLERLNGGGGILSPWNQPQFQPRRAQRPSKLFPVHILPHLYLGNDETAKNEEILEKCRIRYIVNVTSDLPNYFEQAKEGDKIAGDERIKYMRIPVDDNCSHNLAQFFPEAISFIEKARSERAAVLVHCWAGISRSVTVCLAYLMYSLRCTLEEAFDRLLKQNGTIAPNFHFMEALTCWERELFASSFTPSAVGIHLPLQLHHHHQHHLHSPKAKSPTLGPRSPSAFNQIGIEAQTAVVP